MHEQSKSVRQIKSDQKERNVETGPSFPTLTKILTTSALTTAHKHRTLQAMTELSIAAKTPGKPCSAVFHIKHRS